MRKGRFTEEQMVTILPEADQRPVPEVAKKHRVSQQTLYRLIFAPKKLGRWQVLKQVSLDDHLLIKRKEVWNASK